MKKRLRAQLWSMAQQNLNQKVRSQSTDDAGSVDVINVAAGMDRSLVVAL